MPEELKEHIDGMKYSRVGHEYWEHLNALKKIGSPKAIDAIINFGLFDGANAYKRDEAVEALGGLGEKAVPQLIQIMKVHEEPLAVMAVRALGGTGSHTAAEAIVKKLEDPENSIDMKRHLVNALGKLKFLSTCDAIVKHGIMHQNCNVADQAVSALANIGTDKAFESMVWGLLHHDSMTCNSTKKKLNEVVKDNLYNMNIDDKKRDDAHRSLDMLTAGDFANMLHIPSIEKVVNEKPDYNAALAVWALGNQMLTNEKDQEEARKALEAGANHKSALVRAMTARALRTEDVPGAENALIKLLKDDNHQVQMQAIITLADIGTKKCLPHLMTLSGHENWRVNDLVKKAIKEIQEAHKHGN